MKTLVQYINERSGLKVLDTGEIQITTNEGYYIENLVLYVGKWLKSNEKSFKSDFRKMADCYNVIYRLTTRYGYKIAAPAEQYKETAKAIKDLKKYVLKHAKTVPGQIMQFNSLEKPCSETQHILKLIDKAYDICNEIESDDITLEGTDTEHLFWILEYTGLNALNNDIRILSNNKALAKEAIDIRSDIYNRYPGKKLVLAPSDVKRLDNFLNDLAKYYDWTRLSKPEREKFEPALKAFTDIIKNCKKQLKIK